MASDIPIPFVDQEVDTDDPTKGLMTVGVVVIGFAIFAMASSIGANLGQRVNDSIGTLTGVNPAGDSSGGRDLI